MKRLRGIKLKHRKNTEDSATVTLPLPSRVRIPMAMTMGATCKPLVAVGDTVKVGQKIGESNREFSAPVHSGVSGTVAAITDFRTVADLPCQMIEIDTDGEQTVSEEVKPPVITDMYTPRITTQGSRYKNGQGSQRWNISSRKLPSVSTE